MGLFDSLEGFSNTVAVIDEYAEHRSYGELIADADKISNLVPAGALVLFVTSNCYASIAAYVGFQRGRAVPLMVPHTAPKANVDDLINRFHPAFIFMPRINAVNHDFGSPIGEIYNYSLYKLNCAADYETHIDLALLLSTSGSTGSKSFVRLSHSNLECNASQINQYLHIIPSDRAVTTMPMSYSYGLSIINSHLANGAAVVVTDASLVSPIFWQLLKTEKITTFGGVPFIFDMLKKLKFHQMDLPDLRYITQAGGKLNDDLTDYFTKSSHSKNIDFYIMYGQTEATARMTYLPNEYLQQKAGSVGIPVPDAEIWLEDKSCNKITAPNTPGELVFKGGNVSLGYAENCFDLASGDQNGGILKTGDIAERDDDGFYRIVGRKSRFLKLFGNRVNLAEVENLLTDAGFSAACAGSDDNLRIFIEGNPDIKAVETLIKTSMSLPIKGYQLVLIAKLPRGEAGKISYPLLNSEFSAG